MAKKSAKVPSPETVGVSNGDNEVPVLAEAIKDIGKAARKLSKSGINRQGVLVLLKHHSGVPFREINLVLNGLEELEEKYCK